MSSRFLAAFLALILAAGCSIADRRAGVRNNWRTINVSQFVKGQTTEQQVMDALGPPSYVIPLGKRVMFAYFLEESHTVGLNLVVYIQRDTVVRYDRAAFFFDLDHKLEALSLSKTALPTEDE